MQTLEKRKSKCSFDCLREMVPAPCERGALSNQPTSFHNISIPVTPWGSLLLQCWKQLLIKISIKCFNFMLMCNYTETIFLTSFSFSSFPNISLCHGLNIEPALLCRWTIVPVSIFVKQNSCKFITKFLGFVPLELGMLSAFGLECLFQIEN